MIHVRKTQPLHWGHANTYTRRRKADGLSSSNHAKISRGGVFPFFHSFMLCLIELVNWKQKWNMYFSQLWHAIDVKSISVACTSSHGSYVMRTKVRPLTPSQIVTQFLIWFYIDQGLLDRWTLQLDLGITPGWLERVIVSVHNSA